MIALWGGLFLNGEVSELLTAPLELAFHLTAELLTAFALIAAGIGLLTGRKWATRLLLVSLGMVLYSVINAAGFYAQLGDWPTVAAFVALTVTTLVALGAIFFQYPGERQIAARIDRIRAT